MFRNHPTGPRIPRPTPSNTAEEVIAGVRQMLVNVQQEGADVTVTYTTKQGRFGFTFYGAPYKGKPMAQIDAALIWEANEFAKRMGW